MTNTALKLITGLNNNDRVSVLTVKSMLPKRITESFINNEDDTLVLELTFDNIIYRMKDMVARSRDTLTVMESVTYTNLSIKADMLLTKLESLNVSDYSFDCMGDYLA